MGPTGDSVTLKKKGDLPASHWVQRKNPALDADGVHVLQLREGFYVFEPVEHMEEFYGVFRAYLGVRRAKDRLKEAQK